MSARWLSTPERDDELPDRPVELVRARARRQARLAAASAAASSACARRPASRESLGVGGERLAAADDLAARVRVGERLDLDLEADPVGDLRPQLALLLVHRPDEQEPRRVRDRDALPLDDVDAQRRGVEQDVGEVVVEQVDLVDVEDPAVRLGEQARLERPLALLSAPGRRRRCPTTRSSVAFSGRSTMRRRRRTTGSSSRGRARHAAHAGAAGSHENGQSATTVDLRQQLGEAADGGRLARAARALDQDAADRRVDAR